MHVAGLIGAIWEMAGRQCVQNLPPTSGLTLWSHDGAKHFGIPGQKYIRGVPGKWVCFHSNLETFVSQLAKKNLLIQRYLPSPATGARRFLGSGVLCCQSFFPFFVRGLQRPGFFSLAS